MHYPWLKSILVNIKLCSGNAKEVLGKSTEVFSGDEDADPTSAEFTFLQTN